MQSLHETRKRILEWAEAIEPIEVPLLEAVGLVLAEPYLADVDLPPFDRAAIAGYALRSADARPGQTLRIIEAAKVASPPNASLTPAGRAQPSEPIDATSDLSAPYQKELDFSGYDDQDDLFYSFLDDEVENEDSRLVESASDFEPFDFGIELSHDEAVWVELGDPLPIGADAIVSKDDVREEEIIDGGCPRVLELLQSVKAGSNVVPRGHYLRAGTEIARAGTRIQPSSISLLAAQGCIHPACHRRVRVAVLSVGDQLVPPRDEPILHRERNAGGLTLSIPLMQKGALVHDLGAVRISELDQAFHRATTAPVVVILGPDSNPISDVMGRAGVEVIASGVKLDPCDDLTYGVIRDESGRIETHVFRLSPRPMAALMSSCLLVEPLLAKLQGVSSPPVSRWAVWQGTHPSTDNRARVVPVKLTEGPDARLTASPVPFRGVDDLAGFAQADALAVLADKSGPWVGGELVDIISIG